MSWSKFSADAASAIQKAVALQRRTGMKNEYAIEATADLFCMTPRRVRMWLYDEVINPSAYECALIIRRWWVMRDREVNRLRKLADELERGLDREREALQQPQLPWGLNAQTDHGMDRGAAHALARRARQHLDKFDQAEAAYREARRGPLK